MLSPEDTLAFSSTAQVGVEPIYKLKTTKIEISFFIIDFSCFENELYTATTIIHGEAYSFFLKSKYMLKQATE